MNVSKQFLEGFAPLLIKTKVKISTAGVLTSTQTEKYLERD
jgi:hypothetical protein